MNARLRSQGAVIREDFATNASGGVAVKTGGRRQEFGAVLSRAEEGAQLAVEPDRGQFRPFLQTILEVALVRVQHRRPFGRFLSKALTSWARHSRASLRLTQMEG